MKQNLHWLDDESSTLSQTNLIIIFIILNDVCSFLFKQFIVQLTSFSGKSSDDIELIDMLSGQYFVTVKLPPSVKTRWDMFHYAENQNGGMHGTTNQLAAAYR